MGLPTICTVPAESSSNATTKIIRSHDILDTATVFKYKGHLT